MSLKKLSDWTASSFYLESFYQSTGNEATLLDSIVFSPIKHLLFNWQNIRWIVFVKTSKNFIPVSKPL
jgi:hypothetical protein